MYQKRMWAKMNGKKKKNDWNEKKYAKQDYNCELFCAIFNLVEKCCEVEQMRADEPMEERKTETKRKTLLLLLPFAII